MISTDSTLRGLKSLVRMATPFAAVLILVFLFQNCAEQNYKIAVLSPTAIEVASTNPAPSNPMPTPTPTPPPVVVVAPVITRLFARGSSYLALKNGELWAWGRYFNGYNNNPDTKPYPLPIVSDKKWIAASGESSSLGVKADGTLWGWGIKYGSNNPRQIGADTNWASVASEDNHGLALKTDGTLWAWGGYGDAGGPPSFSPYTTPSLTPTQINTPTQVHLGKDKFIAFAAGNGYSAAIEEDGTLWAWGWNGYGQIGNGKSCVAGGEPPYKVGTGFSTISIDYNTTVALKSDGSLYIWGYFGGNEVTSPLLLGQGFSVIANSSMGGLGIKTDGSLWEWGTLWDDAKASWTTVTVPRQIGSGFRQIAAGLVCSFAEKTDGRIYSWGDRGSCLGLFSGTTGSNFQSTPAPVPAVPPF